MQEPQQQENSNTPAPRPAAAPTPPVPVGLPVLRRFWLLLIRPESWAETLRYPLRYTLAPLLIALLVSGIFTGATFGVRFLSFTRQVANTYDARYPAMKYEDGKLTTFKPDTQNAEKDKEAEKYKPVRIDFEGMLIVLDPEDKIKPADLGDGSGIIFGSTEAQQKFMGKTWNTPLKETYPFSTIPNKSTIDGAFINRQLDEQGLAMAITLGTTTGVVAMLRDFIWAFIMMFSVAPILVMGSAPLRMRVQIAWRGTLAVTIPLTVLGGILTAFGYTPAKAVSPEYVPLFWFGATVILTFWTGRLAAKMYLPPKR